MKTRTRMPVKKSKSTLPMAWKIAPVLEISICKQTVNANN